MALITAANSNTSKTITFALPFGTVIQGDKVGFEVARKINLQGLCNAGKPGITIYGGNIRGPGLTLKGHDTVSGLLIGGFKGTQLKGDDDDNRLT